MSYHHFSGGKIKQHENWLLEIIFTKDHAITVEDLNEVTLFREKHFDGRRYCSLIDAREDFLTFTADAKEFGAKHPKIQELRIAEAIVVANIGQELGASLYLRLFQTENNRKVFFNRDEAIKWLEGMYLADTKK